VKDSNQSPRAAKKKQVAKKKGEVTTFTSEIVARVGHEINDRWPNLGPQLASLLRAGREKIDDLYSSAAQALSEHKEAFEDRRAERKELNRVAVRPGPRAASARRSSKTKAANGSVVPPSPKRNSSKSRS
jgi:hypothetical protein